MKPVLKALALLVAIALVVGTAGFVYLMNTGLSARKNPGTLETAIAARVRNLTIGWHADNASNPVERSPAIIAAGRAHFADHCATCHANDGSGETSFGQGMFPKPPDMRLARTQNLSDGELFYIIENGVRFTGMPAFGTGDPSSNSETWHLVHFLRHLPEISEPELAEMESLNPAPPAETRERMLEEQFLKGGERPPAPSAPSHQHNGGHP
jgi:mono/diheme cytochrome c family protein